MNSNNILNDLIRILRNDSDHRIKIEISDWDFRVYLIYDPENKLDNSIIVPIVYEPLEDIIFIPQNELVDSYNCTDFGMDFVEIKLIEQIMQYIEDNSETIKELCSSCSLKGRTDVPETI